MCSDVAKELQNYSSTEQLFLTIWDNLQILVLRLAGDRT